jgi:hypothetical protein
LLSIPRGLFASILSAPAEQLKQHREAIYEVEIESQRTEHRLFICDFSRCPTQDTSP